MYIKTLSIILLSFMITSCSMVGLLIGKLDYYVAKKTSSRLNLYVKQEDKLHRDIEVLFDNLKPDAQSLKSLLASIPKKDKKIGQEFFPDFIGKFKPIFRSVFEKSFTLITRYLGMLTEKQQKLFIDDLEKKNKKARKNLKKNMFFEKVSERFAMLLGKLTPKQKLILKKYRYTFKRWQERRLDINLDFEQGLKKSFTIKDPTLKNVSLKKLGLQMTNQYMATLEGAVFDEIIKSYYLVIKEANPDQRETLDSKVEFINNILTNFIKTQYSD